MIKDNILIDKMTKKKSDKDKFFACDLLSKELTIDGN